MHATTRASRRSVAGFLFTLLATCLLAACGGEQTSTPVGDAAPGTSAADPGGASPGGTNPAGMPPTPFHPPTPPAEPVDPATVVATVNGHPITQGEVDEILMRMTRAHGPVPAARMAMMRAQLGGRVESDLVDQRLMLQAADAAGIQATEDDVANKWKELEAGLPPGAQIEQELARIGMTRERAEQELRSILKIEAYLDSQAEGPKPDEAALESWYAENKERYAVNAGVRARHVLLTFEEGMDKAAKAALKAKLEGLRAEIVKEDGKDFADVAREHSDCPTSAKGGDLGFFPRGQMVPAFDKAAFELEPGVVSEVIETNFGYHIIRVEEKREGGTPDFEAVRARVEADMRGERMQKTHKAVVERLRKTAKIDRPGEDKGDE